MLKLMGEKTFTILHSRFLFILTYELGPVPRLMGDFAGQRVLGTQIIFLVSICAGSFILLVT